MSLIWWWGCKPTCECAWDHKACLCRLISRQRHGGFVLADYEAIQAMLTQSPSMAFALATVRMGIRYEEISVAFWEEIAAHPPIINPTGAT